MQKLKIKGTLLTKFDLQQLNNTRKQRQFDLLIEDGKAVRFSCSQSMCSLIDNFNIGDKIQVRFYFESDNVLVCDHVKLIDNEEK